MTISEDNEFNLTGALAGAGKRNRGGVRDKRGEVEDSSNRNIEPDFLAVMTQHVWTEIARNSRAGAVSHIETVYRPGERVEIWGPAYLPDTSIKMN